MNIFFWKNNNLIDTFANHLAAELYSAIQPELVAEYFGNTTNKKQDKSIKKQLDKEIQVIVNSIEQFRSANNIGVYGKARIHLQFKIMLIELGYDEEIAEALNQHIMVKTP